MTSTLLLTLRGPLQSWGVDSVFPVRRTGPVPSKSGVIGLVASALGRRRGEDLTDLAALDFAVRTEHRGTLLEDFQTATMFGAKNPMLSRGQFLCDAHFTAGLGGPQDRLEEIAHAVRHPRWPLFLGRRSCPPMGPLVLDLVEGRPRDVLARYEPQVSAVFAWEHRDAEHLVLDIIADADSGSTRYEVTRDTPVDFSLERRTHHDRRVEWLRSDPLPNPHRAQRDETAGRAAAGESHSNGSLPPHDPFDVGDLGLDTDRTAEGLTGSFSVDPQEGP